GPAATAYPPIHPDATRTQNATASHRQLSPVLRICHGRLMVSPSLRSNTYPRSCMLYKTYRQVGAFIAGFLRDVNWSLPVGGIRALGGTRASCRATLSVA